MKLRFLLALCTSAHLVAGEAQDLHLTYPSVAEGGEQPYRLFVPSAYDGQHALPLIIAMHGTGGNENTLFDEYDNGAPKRAAEKAGVLLVSPRGALVSEYRGVGEYDVLAVLEEVRRRYRVDESRIYLTGHSMGGTGSAYLALHHPDVFAAAASLAAAYSFPWLARNARSVPTLWIGGAEDNEAYLRGVMPGIDRMLKFGAKPIFELLPGQGHKGPVQDFYRVFAWQLKQQRDLHPKAYTFDVDTPLQGRGFWTTVERLATPGRIACVEAEAVADDTARFALRNVAAFAFAPDPIVFDRQQPIGVTIDGAECWRGLIPEKNELALRSEAGKWFATSRPQVSHPLAEWRAHPVAEAPESLDMLGTEKRLANWITDAMRAATGADIALYSAVYYRGLPIPQGTVDIVDVIQCTRPFDQSLVTVQLTGRNLEDILRANLAALESYPHLAVDRPGSGRVIQVSGLHYIFDSGKPPAERLISTDLDPARTYSVAFEGQVMERQTILLGGRFKQLDYRTTDTPLSMALYAHAAGSGRIEAKAEGRVRDLHDGAAR